MASWFTIDGKVVRKLHVLKKQYFLQKTKAAQIEFSLQPFSLKHFFMHFFSKTEQKNRM